MIAAFERTFRIDEDIRDVLHITDFGVSPPYLEQGVIGRAAGIRRIEQKDLTEAPTPTGCQLVILAFDIVDDRALRPSQQRGHNDAYPFSGACRRKAQYMLRAIVPKIVSTEAAEHDTIRLEQPCGSHFLMRCPPRRAVSCDRLLRVILRYF